MVKKKEDKLEEQNFIVISIYCNDQVFVVDNEYTLQWTLYELKTFILE